MSVRKITKKISVEEYLKGQKRFKHLLTGNEKDKDKALSRIQSIADEHIEHFGFG